MSTRVTMVEPAGSAHAYVALRVAARHYALALHDVVEVVRAVAFEPVPDAPHWLLGIVDVRGSAVPLVDLAARLGLRAPRLEVSDRLVLVETSLGRRALVVDEVLGVAESPSAPFPFASDPESERTACRAAVHLDGQLVLVLDPERLVTHAAATASAE